MRVGLSFSREYLPCYLADERRRRAISPAKPMPNRDKVAGSGVTTEAAAKLTLSRTAPILPGVLLAKTRAAVVGELTVNVSFTTPLVT